MVGGESVPDLGRRTGCKVPTPDLSNVRLSGNSRNNHGAQRATGKILSTKDLTQTSSSRGAFEKHNLGFQNLMCGQGKVKEKGRLSSNFGKNRKRMNDGIAKINESIDALAVMLRKHGVRIGEADNGLRLSKLREKLPRRLPQSFESLLSRYSFPAFDLLGISFFEWDTDANPYTAEASAKKGSLSELLIPAGYVQIGRPDTGDFDAICFDLNQSSNNREYRIVQIDHEEILCNWKILVSGERWPSFLKLVEQSLECEDPQVRLGP